MIEIINCIPTPKGCDPITFWPVTEEWEIEVEFEERNYVAEQYLADSLGLSS